MNIREICRDIKGHPAKLRRKQKAIIKEVLLINGGYSVTFTPLFSPKSAYNKHNSPDKQG